MFRSPSFRHHAADGRTSADMIVTAAKTLTDRHGADYLDDVDVVLTHSQLPEVPVRGCVGEVAHRPELREVVPDVHNGGCAVFILLVELAGDLLRVRGARKALIGLAQNSAGQIFVQEQVRGKAGVHPGDGAAVAVLTLSSPVLDTVCRSYGQYSADMTAVPERKYWGGRAWPDPRRVPRRPRSRKCWPAETGWCPRSRTRSPATSGCRPVISTRSSPINQNRIFPAELA